MGKPAFLTWAEGREERYELVDGRVVMMTRPRRGHAIIVGNLIVALRRRLDSRKWTVIAEFGLDAGPRTLRFPDIVVDTVGGDLDDRWASGPVLLAEVLSGSSRKTDLQAKPAEFWDSRRCKPIWICAARGQGMGLVARGSLLRIAASRDRRPGWPGCDNPVSCPRNRSSRGRRLRWN